MCQAVQPVVVLVGLCCMALRAVVRVRLLLLLLSRRRHIRPRPLAARLLLVIQRLRLCPLAHRMTGGWDESTRRLRPLVPPSPGLR